MNVLSLFDGISCGRVALERIGLVINMYYASEIDKYAIQITQKNYPNTIQLGDVEKIDFSQFIGKIDLIMGGSPCQDLSIAGKRKGLQGERSGLFYKFVEAIEIIKPRYFLFENVASMNTENKTIISKCLGVDPLLIDSSLISAQSRKRLYWTNIPIKNEIKDKGVLLKDIVLENTEVDRDKSYCIDASYYKGTLSDYLKRGRRQHVKDVLNNKMRKLTPVECERLQTLPDNYTAGISNMQRYKCIGNGWTVDVIAHILQNLKGEI